MPTNLITLAAGQWTDLGAGPMTVSAITATPVGGSLPVLQQSDIMPTTLTGAQLADSLTYAGPTHVWAYSRTGATVQVDAAGSTAVSVAVKNDPDNPFVVSLAEDTTITATISTTALAKDATLGTIGTSPPTLDGSSTGIMGVLRTILGKVAGTLTVTAASLPLPSGAATSAKQPVIGVAGTPSSDVISTQGVLNGKPLAVGNRVVKVSVTPTITASSAYASGQAVGGLLSFAGALGTALSGTLLEAKVVDQDGQNVPLDLVLFSAQPATTITDKVAPALTSADMLLATAAVPISAYTAINSKGVAAVAGTGKPIKTDASTTLTGMLIARGTPTWTTTSSISVALVIAQD